jgi:hypothetical protein
MNFRWASTTLVRSYFSNIAAIEDVWRRFDEKSSLSVYRQVTAATVEQFNPLPSVNHRGYEDTKMEIKSNF